MGARVRMSVEARRAQLLAKGRALFATRAYDGLSTDRIAELTGVSKGLLYHYFGSKRGYYLATIQGIADELISVTEPVPDLDVQSTLQQSLAGFVGFVAEHGDVFRALVRGGIGSDGEAAQIIETVRTVSIQRVAEVASLELSPPVRIRLYGWVGFVEAICLDWLEHGDLPPQDVIDLAVSAAITHISEALK